MTCPNYLKINTEAGDHKLLIYPRYFCADSALSSAYKYNDADKAEQKLLKKKKN